jgi:acyl carrier protein
MSNPALPSLLKQQFPTAAFDENAPGLAIGSFPEWDSLAHFNFLLLIEENYGVRFSVEEMAALKGLADIQKALCEKGAA